MIIASASAILGSLTLGWASPILLFGIFESPPDYPRWFPESSDHSAGWGSSPRDVCSCKKTALRLCASRKQATSILRTG